MTFNLAIMLRESALASPSGPVTLFAGRAR